MYLIKGLRWGRGQSIRDVDSYEIARFSRKKEAKGQTRHQRNSTGELLLEKYWEYYWIWEYFEEGEDYYIFRVSSVDGLENEHHIFLVEEEDGYEAGTGFPKTNH